MGVNPPSDIASGRIAEEFLNKLFECLLSIKTILAEKKFYKKW